MHRETLLVAEKPEKLSATYHLPDVKAPRIKDVELNQKVVELHVENLRHSTIDEVIVPEGQTIEQTMVDIPVFAPAPVAKKIQAAPPVSLQPETPKAIPVYEMAMPEQVVPSLNIPEDFSMEIEEVIPEIFEPIAHDDNSDQVSVLLMEEPEEIELPLEIEDFSPEPITFVEAEDVAVIDETDPEVDLDSPNETPTEFEIPELDLEENLQPSPEAGYVGELVMSTLVEFVEIEILPAQPEDAVEIQPLQLAAKETHDDELDSPEYATFPGVAEEFSVYLETFEPAQAETITEVIETLGAAIKKTQKLPEEIPREEKILIEQELEELCIQLFEHLGIDYDEITILRFIQNIKATELTATIDADKNQLSIEQLNSIGTHEYKSSGDAPLLGSLARFIKQKIQPHYTLGRYSLQMCPS